MFDKANFNSFDGKLACAISKMFLIFNPLMYRCIDLHLLNERIGLKEVCRKVPYLSVLATAQT